ncbi:MAG: glycosyltransferase family 4 protein [bacterium]
MERYIFFLAKYLKEKGINVEIITSSVDGKKRQETYEGINFIFLAPQVVTKGIFKFLMFPITHHLFTLNIARYLKNIDFDILHSFGGTPVFYNIFVKKRPPVVNQPFGLEPFKTKGLRKIYNYLFWYLFAKCILKTSDAIASEGDNQTQDIIKIFNISKEKCFNLPDGVDVSIIEKHTANPKITRADIGLKLTDFVLINVNRLAPNKGVKYLIDALNILRKTIKDIKLIIIGTGSEETNILRQIENYGLKDIVLHFKNVDDEKLYNYYSLADAFVCPTLYEGLPIVILEAMACGLPIVATNTAENPQVVKDKINGFLVPVASETGIADGVLRLYENNQQRRQMGIKSKEIIKDYDWKIIAKKAIAKYQQLVENKR